MQNSTLSKAIASVEQVIFNSMNTQLEFTDAGLAQTTLNQIHSGSTNNFAEYMARLEDAPRNPFTIELQTLMNVVENLEDPEQAIESIAEMARPENEINILPENIQSQFWQMSNFFPEENMISPEIFGAIKQYFEGGVHFSQLEPDAQDLANLMRFDDNQLALQYTDHSTLAKMSELRTQLKNDLVSSGVVSRGEIAHLEGMTQDIATTLPVYSLAENLNQAMHHMGATEGLDTIDDLIHGPMNEEDTDMLQALDSEQELTYIQQEEARLASSEPLLDPFAAEPNPENLGEIGDVRPWHQKMFGKEPRASILESEREPLIPKETVMEPSGQPLTENRITRLSPEQGQEIFSQLVDAEGVSTVRANLALSSSGVLVNKGWLESVLEKQLKGFIPSLIAYPILGLINQANPTVGSFVNIGLALGDFAIGVATVFDPVGLIAAGAGEVFKELAVQNQRAVENRDPTQWGGKKFGYVKQFKDGKQYWQPSLLRSAEPVVSFGARGYKVTMETGSDLIYTMDGDGEIAPHFTNPVRHSYNLDEAQLKNEWYSGKDFIEKGDPIKEVYFLNDDEQSQAADLTTDFFAPIEIDKTQLGPMERHLYEMQSALNVAADWKNRNIAKATGTDVDFWKEFEASRTLRAVGLDGASTTYTYWLKPNAERTGITDENYKERRGDFLSHPENDYMLNDVFFNTMKVLLKAQKALADESGLSKYSMSGTTGEKFYGETAKSVW